jgi:hypothetical protein
MNDMAPILLTVEQCLDRLPIRMSEREFRRRAKESGCGMIDSSTRQQASIPRIGAVDPISSRVLAVVRTRDRAASIFSYLISAKLPLPS